MDIHAITLFVEDLDGCRAFYRTAFGLEVVYEDPVSAVFRFGSTLVNLLQARDAFELIAPARIGTGVRAVYTLQVDDVDAQCAAMGSRGIALLNGPIDRPWGVRTASFADPAGHVWELAQPIR